ncbi:MAG: hypothetical protein DRJ03_02685 [Chloroflexi bacterium]|nr:MAG: hypothetical protein DRJ03_02685 [Chloroflexota bacterium]
MAVQGQRTTKYDGAVLGGRIVRDVADGITNVESNMKNSESPGFTILKDKIGGTREVDNPKYEVTEDSFNTRRDNVATAGASAAATTIPVQNSFGNWVRAGSLFYVADTGEVILAGAVASTSLTSCVRNVGGAITGAGATTAEGDGLALTAASQLIHIADTFPEGTYAPSAISRQTNQSYNYTQIEKTTCDISGTLENTKLYGEQEKAYQRWKAGVEHKRKIEFTLFFGARSERQDTTSGHARRTTAGLFQHIKGNIHDISGTGGVLTARELEAWIEMLAENPGSGVKHVFCSTKFHQAASNILKNFVRIDSAKKRLGFGMDEYESAGITLRFVPHRKVFGQNATLVGTALAVDMDFVRYVYLKNRDTKFYEHIENIDNSNGYDGSKDLWQTEYGFEIRGHALDNPNIAATNEFRSVHGKLTGFTTY